MKDISSHLTFLVIADAHLCGGEEKRTEDFFRILDQIDSLPRDCAIVFLGDIFELWVALKSYEDPLHARFLSWCRNAIHNRTVVFLEGNHEFYVTQTRHEAFTKVSPHELSIGGIRFAHGDRINRADYSYRLLRILLRNPFTRLLAALCGPFFGPAAADKIRRSLKNSNRKHKKFFPENAIERHLLEMAEQKKKDRLLVLGHFHRSIRREAHGCTLHVVPAFQDQGEIAVIHCPGKVESAVVEIGNAEKLIFSLHSRKMLSFPQEKAKPQEKEKMKND